MKKFHIGDALNFCVPLMQPPLSLVLFLIVFVDCNTDNIIFTVLVSAKNVDAAKQISPYRSLET